MDAGALQILQELKSGTDAKFFSDAMAIQIGKTGLTIASLLCGISAIYYALCALGVMGASKRGVGAMIAVFILGFGSFLLNEKAGAMLVIDDSRPVLAIDGTNLEYDVRRDGWSIPWSNVSSVELVTSTTQKKQSVEQSTYEVRVNTKPNALITWKYQPDIDNDVAASKKRQDTGAYLVIDPEPLGISPQELQKALEKYRAGL